MLAGVRGHLLWSGQVREFETKANDGRAAKDVTTLAQLSTILTFSPANAGFKKVGG